MSEAITIAITENTETITQTIVENGETITLTINEAARGAPGADATGDVVGPASATDGRPALFDGVTGKLIKQHTAALGTAAVKNIPATGNASETEVVYGTDTRLTDARTPSSTLAHKASHATGQADAIAPSDIGAAAASHAHAWSDITGKPIEIQLACSDETTALTVGDGKAVFRAPCAFLLTAVRCSVTTAPTGAALQVQIRNAGNDVLSTKLSIDATAKTSVTSGTPAVINASYDDFADDAEIHIDVDQIGGSVAGAGLKVTLIGTRT